MAKEITFHLRTDFDRLKIAVTDDASVIEEGAEKLKPSMRSLKNNGTHDEKKDADLFFDACTNLKKKEKREKLIQSIVEAAASQLRINLDSNRGKPLTAVIYQELQNILVKQFNFESSLAKRKLDEFLTDEGTTIGDVIVFSKASPVQDLRAKSRADGVQLTWKCPDSDCDGIVLVRTQTGRPHSHKEGTELLKSKADLEKECQFLDITAAPDRKYTYAVFSVLRGEVSSECCHCDGFRLPNGLDDFRAKYVHPAVELRWSAPDECRKVWLFRTTDAGKTIPIAGDRPTPPPGAFVPIIVANEEKCTDNSVSLGAVYFYHAFADHGDGRISEAAVTTIRIPSPVTSPLPKGFNIKPGCITIEWSSTSHGTVAFHLYRSNQAGLTDLEKATPVYEGPDTRFDDRGVETGQAYWYYVIVRNEGLVSNPTRLGPVVAIGEVEKLDALSGHRSIHLKWTRPRGAVNVRVRRGKGSAPGSMREGEEVICATAIELVDNGLEPECGYGYRVASVFRDPDGREIVSPGVATKLCKPFEMPQSPRNVKAVLGQGQVIISWEASNVAEVFRLPADLPGKATVPLSDLIGNGQRLPVSKGRETHDTLDHDYPWYVLATVMRENSVVIHQRVHVIGIECLLEKQDDGILLRWFWPDGVKQVRLTRKAIPIQDDDNRGVAQAWLIDRMTNEAEHEIIDPFENHCQPHTRVYELELVRAVGDGPLLLNSARTCSMFCGEPARISYRILPPENKGWFSSGLKRLWLRDFLRRLGRDLLGRWFSSNPKRLWLRVDRRILNFQGVRLVAQPSLAEGSEGETLLHWPGKPGNIGPTEITLEIPPPKSEQNRYATLLSNSDKERADVVIYPIQAVDKRML